MIAISIRTGKIKFISLHFCNCYVGCRETELLNYYIISFMERKIFNLTHFAKMY